MDSRDLCRIDRPRSVGDTAAGALSEWLTLTALVDEIGAVPCRKSDPEAWWLDWKQLAAPRRAWNSPL